MNPQPIATPSHGLDLGDIYYLLFRHKWKILLCTVAGLAAAGAIYRSEAPPFQSEARLLVRYILSESKATGPATGNSPAKISPDERGASIMNTEMEILNSMNLASQVAEAIGPEKVLAKAGGGTDLVAATMLIKGNLAVSVGQSSSVIHVSFKHPDAELVREILIAIIDRYLKMHVEAHRSTGMLAESLAAEADTLRGQLNQTDDELRRAIAQAGAISPDVAKEGMSNQMVAIRREIQNFESELAARLAVYEELKKRQTSPSTEPAKPDAVPEVPPAVIDEFRTLYSQLSRFQTIEQEYLVQFLPESPRVKDIQTRRIEAEAKVAKMRAEHPGLLKVSTQASLSDPMRDQATEVSTAWIQITAYQAKIKELNSQLERLRADMARLDRAEGPINDLKRKKELQDQHYRYYQAALEQSRINQAVGDGKVSNITQIQTPSPPFRAAMNTRKVGLAAAIGIFAGLAWAFIVEMYFDRSVRRPKDLQRLIRTPLFLSIPRLRSRDLALRLEAPTRPALTGGNGHSNGDAGGGGALSATPEPVALGRIDALQPFHETLRDRLIGYFESRNLTHKPKLVAVTSLRRGAGVTTTATGLARSLSETGEGNVLLVDMTAEQGSAQQFNHGKPVCGLDEMLETRSHAHVTEHLYVVAEGSNSERLSRNLPQRFTRLVPKLKASDFDYIIFDMPTVNQLSITPRLAGFMDMVMMVIESEKTDRELVEGACSMLAESKAHIGIVLNKTKNYVPNALQQQLSAT